MDILTIILQAVLFYCVYKLGQWSVLLPMKMALEKLAKSKGIDLQAVLEELKEEVNTEQKPDKEIYEAMDVERVNGVYFAYGDQGRFLAQGSDFRSMMETIKQRFPQHSFRINRYNPNLTEEEAGSLVKAIFETFGDKNDRSKAR